MEKIHLNLNVKWCYWYLTTIWFCKLTYPKELVQQKNTQALNSKQDGPVYFMAVIVFAQEKSGSSLSVKWL